MRMLTSWTSALWSLLPAPLAFSLPFLPLLALAPAPAARPLPAPAVESFQAVPLPACRLGPNPPTTLRVVDRCGEYSEIVIEAARETTVRDASEVIMKGRWTCRGNGDGVVCKRRP